MADPITSSSAPKTRVQGWLVVAVCTLSTAFSSGTKGTMGLLAIEWEKCFGLSRQYVSGVVALLHIVHGVVTPLSGHVVDLNSSRSVVAASAAFFAACLMVTATIQHAWQLWIVFGVAMGIGLGFLNFNVMSVAIVRAVHSDHVTRASGIAMAGGAVGTLAIVPLFSYVMLAYGWRIALYILAGMILMIVPLTLVLFKSELNQPQNPKSVDLAIPPSDSNIPPSDSKKFGSESTSNTITRNQAFLETVEEEEESVTIPEHLESDIIKEPLGQIICRLFQNKTQLILMLVKVLCGYTSTGFAGTHLIALVEDRGLTQTEGATVLAIVSGASGVGLILVGFLSDKFSCKGVLIGIFLLRGLAYVLLHFATTRASLIGFAVVYGLGEAGTVPPSVQLLLVATGKETLGISSGLVFFMHAVGTSIGMYTSGAMYSHVHNYTMVIWICSILSFLCVPLLMLLPTSKTKDDSDVNTKTNTAGESTSSAVKLDDGGATPNLSQSPTPRLTQSEKAIHIAAASAVCC